jgi:hypothetical protein
VTLTKFEALIGLMVAILTVLGIVSAGLRWIYKQGVSSTNLVNAVTDNTEATDKLTHAYETFTEKTANTLLDHEKRITRMEAVAPSARP